MDNLTCPNCGATLKSDMKFCEFCGTAIIQEFNTQEVYTDYDAFLHSVRAVSYPSQAHLNTFRWLVTLALCFTDTILVTSYNLRELTFASLISVGSIVKLLAFFCCYVVFCLVIHTFISTHYAKHVKLPRGDEELRNALGYIGWEVDNLSKMCKGSWKKSIRLDAWIKCLHAHGFDSNYKSNRLIACIVMALWHMPYCAFHLFVCCYGK